MNPIDNEIISNDEDVVSQVLYINKEGSPIRIANIGSTAERVSYNNTTVQNALENLQSSTLIAVTKEEPTSLKEGDIWVPIEEVPEIDNNIDNTFFYQYNFEANKPQKFVTNHLYSIQEHYQTLTTITNNNNEKTRGTIDVKLKGPQIFNYTNFAKNNPNNQITYKGITITNEGYGLFKINGKINDDSDNVFFYLNQPNRASIDDSSQTLRLNSAYKMLITTPGYNNRNQMLSSIRYTNSQIQYQEISNNIPENQGFPFQITVHPVIGSHLKTNICLFEFYGGVNQKNPWTEKNFEINSNIINLQEAGVNSAIEVPIVVKLQLQKDVIFNNFYIHIDIYNASLFSKSNFIKFDNNTNKNILYIPPRVVHFTYDDYQYTNLEDYIDNELQQNQNFEKPHYIVIETPKSSIIIIKEKI